MEKFDKHIKDQLADFEMQPPPGFWHTISDRLDQESNVAVVTAAPFNYARLLRIAAVFIGLFSLGTLSYLKYTPSAEPVVATLTLAPVKENANLASPATEVEVTAPVVTNAKMATNLAPLKAKQIETTAPIEIAAKLIEINPTTALAENKETTTEFNLLESNIPVYSLKLLNKKVPSNDEITVIQSNKTNTSIQTAPAKTVKKQPLPWRF